MNKNSRISDSIEDHEEEDVIGFLFNKEDRINENENENENLEIYSRKDGNEKDIISSNNNNSNSSNMEKIENSARKRYNWIKRQLPLLVRPLGVEKESSYATLEWISENLKSVRIRYKGKVYSKANAAFTRMLENAGINILNDITKRKDGKKKIQRKTFWDDAECQIRPHLPEEGDTEKDNPLLWCPMKKVIPAYYRTSLNTLPKDNPPPSIEDEDTQHKDQIKSSKHVGRKRKLSQASDRNENENENIEISQVKKRRSETELSQQISILTERIEDLNSNLKELMETHQSLMGNLFKGIKLLLKEMKKRFPLLETEPDDIQDTPTPKK